jgi:hypothetical protein
MGAPRHLFVGGYLWAPRRVCPPTSAGGWTVDLVADRVGSRFKQLARLVGRSGSIVRR